VKPEDATVAMAVGLLSLPPRSACILPMATRCRPASADSGPIVYDKGKEGKEYRSLKGGMMCSRCSCARSNCSRSRSRAVAAAATPIRVLGNHPDDKQPIGLYEGQYGPYVKHGDVSASLPRGSEPAAFTAPEAIELLAEAGVIATRTPRCGALEKEEGRRDVKKASVIEVLAGCEAAWALAEQGVR
jgi:DNA topoisomerase-1